MSDPADVFEFVHGAKFIATTKKILTKLAAHGKCNRRPALIPPKVIKTEHKPYLYFYANVNACRIELQGLHNHKVNTTVFQAGIWHNESSFHFGS